MSTKIIPKSRSLSCFVTKIPMVDHAAKKMLCSHLKKIKYGTLTLIDQDETLVFGEGQDIKVAIKIIRSSFYSRTLLGGSIGNAESFVDGDWECTNLTDMVRLFVKNREILQKIDSGLVNLLSPLQKTFHGLRSNTLEGSKKNIRSHYDMGNDFFELFLDPTMMYSCALFESDKSTLEDASINKLRTICEKLKLNENDHLLEVGTGWGGMAIFAAQNYGCRVTTTTISKEQFEYASSKVRSLGLEGKIEVLFEDYRKLQGVYDKLVSIEMIEAVGLNNLNTYFEVCSRLLKPRGLMVLQAITIRDQYYENAKKSVDFIQTHIFPGSGIPSVNAMINSITQESDMVLISQQDYAEDYAQTIWHWNNQFHKKIDAVLSLGYPEFLPRLWDYYFAYCEGGFRERVIGLTQMVLAKPEYKNRSLV
jgi:cyclopropane-fatty-acyl-phospholipid synthase